MNNRHSVFSILAVLVILFGLPGAAVAAADPSQTSPDVEPAYFPKSDFAGVYFMNHDGWEGYLELWGVPDILGYPNMEGRYTGSDGLTHDVYGWVTTEILIPDPGWGPDHQIEFHIDFEDTPGDVNDDQMFIGFLHTQTRNAISGITWWGEEHTPFGFYAIKTGAPLPKTAYPKALASEYKEALLGTYYMNHDGWEGKLVLWALADDMDETTPNIAGVYTGSDGIKRAVSGWVSTVADPMPVPFRAHQINFTINTGDLLDPTDDQPFEGFLFTQTQNAIAGATYWSGIPFGFYALAQGQVYLPAIKR